jgi:hypothetical protein
MNDEFLRGEACPNGVDGAAGTIIQLAQHDDLPRPRGVGFVRRP